MDFSNLEALEVKQDSTIEFPLTDIPWDPTPVLILGPATEENKPFFNALVREQKENRMALESENPLGDARDRDRKLYADHGVIRGWSGVRNKAGEEVPYTRQNAVAFLGALPGWIFDKVRAAASSHGRFVDRDAVEAAAGNSNGA